MGEALIARIGGGKPEGQYVWNKYTVVSSAKGEFITCVADNNETKYPDDGEQGGYYYEKVVDEGDVQYAVINGILDSYYVYLGNTSNKISANTFVEFYQQKTQNIYGGFTLNNGGNALIQMVRLSDTRILVCYNTSTSSFNAIVFEIDDTTITYGAPVVVSTSSHYVYSCSFRLHVLDDSRAFCNWYNDTTQFYVVLSVSGTTITVNTPVSVVYGYTTHELECAKLDANTFMSCIQSSYSSGYTTYRYIKITVNNTTITTAASGSMSTSDTSSNTSISSFIGISETKMCGFMYYKYSDYTIAPNFYIYSISGNSASVTKTIGLGTVSVSKYTSGTFTTTGILDSTHIVGILSCSSGYCVYLLDTVSETCVSSLNIPYGTTGSGFARFDVVDNKIIMSLESNKMCAVITYSDTYVMTLSSAFAIAETTELPTSGGNSSCVLVKITAQQYFRIIVASALQSTVSIVQLKNDYSDIDIGIGISVNKIDGITKTECTKVLAGEAYSLNLEL